MTSECNSLLAHVRSVSMIGTSGALFRSISFCLSASIIDRTSFSHPGVARLKNSLYLMTQVLRKDVSCYETRTPFCPVKSEKSTRGLLTGFTIDCPAPPHSVLCPSPTSTLRCLEQNTMRTPSTVTFGLSSDRYPFECFQVTFADKTLCCHGFSKCLLIFWLLLSGSGYSSLLFGTHLSNKYVCLSSSVSCSPRFFSLLLYRYHIYQIL